MMANPVEYHTMMYEFFWNGNLPTERTTPEGKRAGGKVIPKKQLDELAAIRQRDLEKRAKREAERAAERAVASPPNG
jgi:hypothetical protein